MTHYSNTMTLMRLGRGYCGAMHALVFYRSEFKAFEVRPREYPVNLYSNIFAYLKEEKGILLFAISGLCTIL